MTDTEDVTTEDAATPWETDEITVEDLQRILAALRKLPA